MKVECSFEKLKKYISLANRVVGKNTTLPILESVLLYTQDNSLKIRATNLDIGVEFSIHAKVIQQGNIAIPGNILIDVLANIKNENSIILELIGDNLTVSVKNNTILIRSLKPDDFPTLPKVDNGIQFTIPAKSFLSGLLSVHYSSAVSDIKPEYSSVFIYQESGTLIFVATDSLRLAEKKIQNKNVEDFDGVIIPIKNIHEISKIVKDIDGEIIIHFNKNQLSIVHKDIYITTRVVNGIFPDYQQIIPKESTTNIIVLKQDILDALKITNIFSDNFNKINININKKDKVCEINAKNDKGENTTRIEAAISGEDITANFNQRHIMDYLQTATDDSISISFNGENKPMVIRGVNNNSFLYIITQYKK